MTNSPVSDVCGGFVIFVMPLTVMPSVSFGMLARNIDRQIEPLDVPQRRRSEQATVLAAELGRTLTRQIAVLGRPAGNLFKNGHARRGRMRPRESPSLTERAVRQECSIN